jgi:hypothetical protein
MVTTSGEAPVGWARRVGVRQSERAEATVQQVRNNSMNDILQRHMIQAHDELTMIFDSDIRVFHNFIRRK